MFIYLGASSVEVGSFSNITFSRRPDHRAYSIGRWPFEALIQFHLGDQTLIWKLIKITLMIV